MDVRIESDSMGEVKVPKDRYYGAQTQRSLDMFKIGSDRFPPEFIHSFALLKKAAATANLELGLLAKEKAEYIFAACDEIIAGEWDDHFPLVVWQTGSGTQTHMNLNEVIAHRAQEKAKEKGQIKIDAHDDVNMSQSSNDIFSTVMHVVAAQQIAEELLPKVAALRKAIEKKSEAYQSLIKLGRTHMMDATPMTFGQELSGYAAQLAFAEDCIQHGLKGLYPLPIGGTAIGTGLNTPPRFAEVACEKLSAFTKLPFEPAENKFALIAAHDPLVYASSCLKVLATACIKIANDLRLLGSGPRGGFGEIRLPANEPGSSIMPGKVNPTQVEALTMVSIQVMGNDFAISFAGSQGQLELNTYKPLIIHNLTHSIRLLGDACKSFRENCVEGMEPVPKQMRAHLDRSLMMVTALNPVIGYDAAAKLAKYALDKDLSLRDAAKELGTISMEEFDRVVKPETMLGPKA